MAEYAEHWRDGSPACIVRNGDGFIPLDPGNMCYVDYLAWKAAGGIPDVVADVDPPPPPPPPTVDDAKGMGDVVRQLNALKAACKAKGIVI